MRLVKSALGLLFGMFPQAAPKRSQGFFSTWTCVRRFKAALRLLFGRTRRFSEPTFRPSGATNHWKNTVNRDFSTFPAPASHLLSSDSFSSLIFSLLLFSSLTLPTSAFPSVQIVGSLTSKLPSIIVYYSHLQYAVISYMHTCCMYMTNHYIYIYIHTHTVFCVFLLFWFAG